MKTQEFLDHTKHASQQVTDVLVCQMQLMRTSGGRSIYGVAMTLSVADHVAFKGIGMMLLTVPASERHRAAAAAIAKLAADLTRRIPEMMTGIDDAETRARERMS